MEVSETGPAWLLDVGEGTLGQLFRARGHPSAAGATSALDLLRRTTAVLVSHMHADHHLGLVGVLLARHRVAPTAPLLVVGPAPLELFLAEVGGCVALAPYTFIDAELLRDVAGSPARAHVARSLGVSDVEAVPVIHCPLSYGYVFAQQQGVPWKLVYVAHAPATWQQFTSAASVTDKAFPPPVAPPCQSFSGDTRPCNALIAAGQQATWLIHEATFEDQLQADAFAKRHSTLTEALSVGVQYVVDTWAQTPRRIPPTELNSCALLSLVPAPSFLLPRSRSFVPAPSFPLPRSRSHVPAPSFPLA